MSGAAPRRGWRDRFVEWLIALNRKSSGLARKTATVQGEDWFFLEGGPSDAEHSFLLVHGFGSNKDTWIRLGGALTKKGCHVIAVDLPGFGESARHLHWSYDMVAQRERLHGFVQALGLRRRHIVGNSMGGYLAALYADEHGQHVASLGLLDNAGVAPQRENEMHAAVARGENPLLVQSLEDFDRLLDFVMHVNPPMPGMVKRYLAEHALERRDFNARIFDHVKDELAQGLESILPRIKLPTLVLWGRHDRVIDVTCVETMRPMLPHASNVILEDAGHLPHFERPYQVAAHLLELAAARR